jgi:hypothetical protein
MAAGKTIYRVRHIVAADVAVISEVKEGEFNGKIRETRDPRIILGGVDSFWAVGTEKAEPKIRMQSETSIVPGLMPASTAPISSRIRGSSSFDLTKILNDDMAPGQFDAVSFSSVTRLSVGFSPKETDSQLLASLIDGSLHVPLGSFISAIEILPGKWLTSGFDHTASGRYLLRSKSLRAVKTVSLTNRPEMLRVARDVVVFTTEPKWSDAIETDLRPQEEIIRAAEMWLERSKTAIRLNEIADPLKPVDFLNMLIDSTVSEEERADLASVSEILSERTELLDILPNLVGRGPEFRERMAAFEEAEKARVRSEIEQRLLSELETEAAKLAKLQSDIADAETKLALISHREALLRTETEKHDAVIRQRIADAAEAIKNEVIHKAARVLEDVEKLRDEIVQIASPPATAAPYPEPPVPETQTDAIDTPFELASDEQRKQTILELSAATSLPVQEVATIITLATEAIPVLIGAEASTAAVDIVTALSGERASVVFCDPTKVSLSDLLADEQSGLKSSIETARAHPEALIGVAFCGVTNGPCEYWLPQMMEMRRSGRLPRNLSFVASVATDGNRVSVPPSVLRHLLPMTVNGNGRPGQATFKAYWPVPDGPRADRLRAVLEDFIEVFEGSSLQPIARSAARVPDWIKIGDLRAIFLRQTKWLAAVASGEDHDFNKYFKNIEG